MFYVLFSIILHNSLPINMFICLYREICQLLVQHAVGLKRCFCPMPFWSESRRLCSCKQSFLFVCCVCLCICVIARGGWKNRYIVISQYFAWRYCIDLQIPRIDILLNKFLINVAKYKHTSLCSRTIKIIWLFSPLDGAKCSLVK